MTVRLACGPCILTVGSAYLELFPLIRLFPTSSRVQSLHLDSHRCQMKLVQEGQECKVECLDISRYVHTINKLSWDVNNADYEGYLIDKLMFRKYDKLKCSFKWN